MKIPVNGPGRAWMTDTNKWRTVPDPEIAPPAPGMQRYEFAWADSQMMLDIPVRLDLADWSIPPETLALHTVNELTDAAVSSASAAFERNVMPKLPKQDPPRQPYARTELAKMLAEAYGKRYRPEIRLAIGRMKRRAREAAKEQP